VTVPVTQEDVRHIATLARLGIPPERVPRLVAELNGILSHMDVLAKVATGAIDAALGVGAGGMPLRADDGEQYPVARDRSEFAPAMADGFFLVPRLASHADVGVDGVDATEDAANEVHEG
jgi:aspartyl-tRNA(Asn)/glutamyl-tRNA(Gln) amidotransferase subunit C